jgi:hypothetical protein
MGEPKKSVTAKQTNEFLNDANQAAEQAANSVEAARKEIATDESTEVVNVSPLYVPDNMDVENLMSGFDEAEQEEGVGISAKGLKMEKDEEVTLLFAKRGEVFSGIKKELVDAVFFLQKDRSMVFTSSAAVVSALTSTGTLEDGVANYVKIKFLGKEPSKDGTKTINRYDIRLCNPAKQTVQPSKQIGG